MQTIEPSWRAAKDSVSQRQGPLRTLSPPSRIAPLQKPAATTLSHISTAQCEICLGISPTKAPCRMSGLFGIGEYIPFPRLVLSEGVDFQQRDCVIDAYSILQSFLVHIQALL